MLLLQLQPNYRVARLWEHVSYKSAVLTDGDNSVNVRYTQTLHVLEQPLWLGRLLTKPPTNGPTRRSKAIESRLPMFKLLDDSYKGGFAYRAGGHLKKYSRESKETHEQRQARAAEKQF